MSSVSGSLHLPPAWSPDLGDGRYRNPVLHADYSDPDAVRVGDDYYLVASSFTCVPGLPILHSRDLVNWQLIGHALPELVPTAHFAVPRHGQGVWAPAIRHRAGKFWIFYPDPDFGLYFVTAHHPAGPWSAPHLVKAGRGLIDPCPLWDDDGKVYLIHGWAKSRAGINNMLTVLRLSADALCVEEDLGAVIDGARVPMDGFKTLEGPKFYKRDGWYYVLAPAGGVATGWQSAFRSRDIRGPYEHRVVLAQGSTAINGPHQGALVDTPAGDWWFLHFQDKDAYGRIVHLQPVTWRDGWPVMGNDPSGSGTGEPVRDHRKPAATGASVAVPATTDEFAQTLGLQWQWQANPQASWSSLTARPGHLRLFSQAEPQPANLYRAPHLPLQKFPATEFVVTTQLEFAAKATGETAGLIVFGYDYAWIGLRATETGAAIVFAQRTEAAKGEPQAEQALVADGPLGPVWLRVVVREGARCQFSFSTDGVRFIEAGVTFTATCGHWVGAKVGLFASALAAATQRGHADFDWFRVEALRS